MKVGITGNDRSAVRPVTLLFYQFIAHRIGERVEAKTRKSIAPPFFSSQDVIVRLMLPFAPAAKRRFKMRAQKFHGVELISLASQSHPDEMKMVGHQTVSGAEQMFARGGVEHQFTKRGMERGGEPASRTFFQRIRPENYSVALIMMPLQSRKLSLVRWSHGEDMEIIAMDVKNSASPVAAEVTRRKPRNSMKNPPPHVGGYVTCLVSKEIPPALRAQRLCL